MPSDLLAFKKSIEDSLATKLYTMFEGIPDVKIAVNAIPDLSVHKTQTDIYTPSGKVSAQTESTTTETSSNEGSGTGEPGVKPNVSAVADSGSGRKVSSTSNASTNKNEVHFSHTVDDAILPAGTNLKDLTASISIPRSYFVSIYRRASHTKDADPDDDKLQDTIDKQLKLAKTRARNTIGAKSDDQISVDWFDDTIALHQVDVTQAGIVSGSLQPIMKQWGKPIILLGLAGFFLSCMLMMIRKAALAGAAGGEVDPGVFFGGGGSEAQARADAGPAIRTALTQRTMVFGEANEGRGRCSPASNSKRRNDSKPEDGR